MPQFQTPDPENLAFIQSVINDITVATGTELDRLIRAAIPDENPSDEIINATVMLVIYRLAYVAASSEPLRAEPFAAGLQDAVVRGALEGLLS